MTRSNARIVGSAIFLMAVLCLCALPSLAQENNTWMLHADRFAVSAPLSDYAKLPQPPQYGFHEANPVRHIVKPNIGVSVDRTLQSSAPGGSNYAVGADILGVGNGFPNYTVPDAPPDTNMAVGDTQIVQWVNVSYTVCSKTSPYTCGPAIAGNLLWQNLGGQCFANNDGDIIAQWDNRAHRWLLTQNVFASPYGVCVAISTSSDATGTYYLYHFNVPDSGFPDYPKWGVWTVNYGETWNDFGPGGSGFKGPMFCAYNRTKMLAGDQSAEQICHLYGITPNYNDSLLPADLDSPTNPPNGEDQFAIGSIFDIDNTHLSLYSVHINDPNNWGSGATFTGDADSQLVPVAQYNGSCGGNYGGACVPQKGITDLVDSLGDRLMYRFAYWEDQPLVNVRANPPLPAPAQHWLVNFDVAASNYNQNAPHWYEFTAPIKKINLPTDLALFHVFQEGTYAPDGNWRWMGSVARDKVGNILVGYSKSCGDTCPGGTAEYPSVYIAGRIVNDPLGLGKLEPEVQVVEGSGSQPDTSNRWGDYSSMRIDLNDGMNGCTFWYTTEYYQVTQRFDWSTQVASIKFNNCN